MKYETIEEEVVDDSKAYRPNKEILCQLSVLILPGTAKCLSNWRSLSSTCRECDLPTMIEKRFTPIESRDVNKELEDIIANRKKINPNSKNMEINKYGFLSCGDRKEVSTEIRTHLKDDRSTKGPKASCGNYTIKEENLQIDISKVTCSRCLMLYEKRRNYMMEIKTPKAKTHLLERAGVTRCGIRNIINIDTTFVLERVTCVKCQFLAGRDKSGGSIIQNCK